MPKINCVKDINDLARFTKEEVKNFYNLLGYKDIQTFINHFTSPRAIKNNDPFHSFMIIHNIEANMEQKNENKTTIWIYSLNKEEKNILKEILNENLKVLIDIKKNDK